MSQPETQTAAKADPPAEVSPTLAQQIAAMIPAHAHANGGLFGDRTWHWSTPNGVWLITLICPMLGSWQIRFAGNGSKVELPPNQAGLLALRHTLIAFGAIEGGDQ